MGRNTGRRVWDRKDHRDPTGRMPGELAVLELRSLGQGAPAARRESVCQDDPSGSGPASLEIARELARSAGSAVHQLPLGKGRGDLVHLGRPPKRET